MAILSPVLRQRFFDSNGRPLAGGKLYSYAAGTTTPAATYADQSGTPNTNPVVLDANGEADVWIAFGAYKFILHDANDVQQWVVDHVMGSQDAEGGGDAGGDLSGTFPAPTVTGIQGVAVDALTESEDGFSPRYNHAEGIIEWVGLATQSSLNTTNITVGGLNVALVNHINAQTAHGIDGAVVGTTDQQTLTEKTIGDALTFNELNYTPAAPSAGKQKIYAKDDGKVYRLDSDGLEKEVGSGGGGIGGVNFLENANAATDEVIWETYANVTPGDEPTPNDLTTATGITVTREESGGKGYFRFTKDASNRQGSGFRLKDDFPIRIAPEDLYDGKDVYIKGPYISDLPADTFQFFAYYDNAGTLTKAELTPYAQASGRIQLKLTPMSGVYEYWLFAHIVSTTASAGNFDFVLEQVGPSGVVPVPIARNEVIDVTGSGSFTGGKVRVTLNPSGQVTISVVENITFASSATPTSAAGLLPEWARPEIEAWNEYAKTSTQLFTIQTFSSGVLSFLFRDYTGTSSVRTNSGTSATLSYNVAKPSSALMSDLEIANETKEYHYKRDSSDQTVSSASETDVVFNSIVTGSSSEFATGTGIWTAPQAGKIDARATLRLGGTSDEIYVARLYKNSEIIDIFTLDIGNSGGGSIVVQSPFSLHVNAGDTVKVTIDSAADTSYTVVRDISYLSITFRPTLTAYASTGSPYATMPEVKRDYTQRSVNYTSDAHVPIVASGSNSDGHWVRYADGTQVCTNLIELGSPTAEGLGTYANPYRTNGVNWTYPLPFISNPKVSILAYAPGAPTYSRGLVPGANGISSTGVSTIRGTKVSDNADTNTAYANVIAIGRWK